MISEIREQPQWRAAPPLGPEPVEDSIGISNSELATWKRCRRKWFLHYFLGFQADQESVTSNAQLGTRIHVALQAYYGYGMDPIKVIRAIYQREAELHPTAAADLVKEFDMAVAILEGYAEWLEETGADRGLVPVAAEQQVWFPLGDIQGFNVYLRAHLDVVMFSQFTGQYLFMDHKTVASFDSANLLLINEQMKMYVMLQRLIARRDGTWVDGGIFNMLKRSKRTARANPPFNKREPVQYNGYDMESMWRRTYQTVSEIMVMRRGLNEAFYGQPEEAVREKVQQALVPPTPAAECSWQCPFLTQCPMMDDGSRWFAALEGRFKRGDPYAYYSRGLLETLTEEGRI